MKSYMNISRPDDMWWKSEDLMKHWVLNLLCLYVLASPHPACTCLCFWAKAQCTLIPALLRLATDSPFSLAVRSSPALAPASAAVKQEGGSHVCHSCAAPSLSSGIWSRSPRALRVPMGRCGFEAVPHSLQSFPFFPFLEQGSQRNQKTW